MPRINKRYKRDREQILKIPKINKQRLNIVQVLMDPHSWTKVNLYNINMYLIGKIKILYIFNYYNF